MAKNKLEVGGVVSENISSYDPRDYFIGIAMRELLIQQIERKDFGKYDVVATHAVKYADAVMKERNKDSKPFVVANGERIKIDLDSAAAMPSSNPIAPPGAPVIPSAGRMDSQTADAVKAALKADEPLGEAFEDPA